jgi:hypothetical protein
MGEHRPSRAAGREIDDGADPDRQIRMPPLILLAQDDQALGPGTHHQVARMIDAGR